MSDKRISIRQVQRLRRTIEIQQSRNKELEDKLSALNNTSRMIFRGAVTKWQPPNIPTPLLEEARIAWCCGCRLLIEYKSDGGGYVITRAVEV